MHIIYEYPSDAGTMTCAKYPGSLGHEAEDASSFSVWGFDCASSCSRTAIFLISVIEPDLKYGVAFA